MDGLNEGHAGYCRSDPPLKLNISTLEVTFDMSQHKTCLNDVALKNILYISITWLVFHFEI